ncbi:MAG: hypothetical protein Q9197_006185 [Variospora fuerteventurae]
MIGLGQPGPPARPTVVLLWPAPVTKCFHNEPPDLPRKYPSRPYNPTRSHTPTGTPSLRSYPLLLSTLVSDNLALINTPCIIYSHLELPHIGRTVTPLLLYIHIQILFQFALEHSRIRPSRGDSIGLCETLRPTQLVYEHLLHGASNYRRCPPADLDDNMNQGNFPNMSGQSMPMQMGPQTAPPPSTNLSVQQFILRTLSQQPHPPGWQTSVQTQFRANIVFQMYLLYPLLALVAAANSAAASHHFACCSPHSTSIIN